MTVGRYVMALDLLIRAEDFKYDAWFHALPVRPLTSLLFAPEVDFLLEQSTRPSQMFRVLLQDWEILGKCTQRDASRSWRDLI